MAAATGLDVRDVAAEVVRSVRGIATDKTARLPLMSTDPEVDVEVLVDEDLVARISLPQRLAQGLAGAAGVPGSFHHPLSGGPDGEPRETF